MFNNPLGGGVRKSLLDSITANANDILSGKVVINSDGELLTGTMTNRGTWNSSVGINGSVTIPAGYHNGSGRVTNSVSTMGGQTITPRSTSQTVSCSGRYMTGNIVVNGDSNLVAANIISGKSIFGVAGNARSYRQTTGSKNSTGSVRYQYSEDGSTSTGTFYYYDVNPGFTPTFAFAAKTNDGSRTCMDTTWNSYLLHRPDWEGRTVNKSTNGVPFTSSNTRLVLPDSGSYGYWIVGYS